MNRSIQKVATRGLVAACFLVIAGCTSQPTNRGPGETGNEPKADFKVTAVALAEEYIADSKAAETKYKDKVIEVTGPLSKTGVVNKTTINLAGARKDEKDFLGVSFNCNLKPAFHDRSGYLCEGQKLKVTGKWSSTFAGVILLADCSLAELEPSKVLKLDAAEITKEFSIDEEAAKKKYHDVDVVVTGELHDVSKNDGFHFARLKGANNQFVKITMGAEETAGLRQGQKVTVRANFSFPELKEKEVAAQMGRLLEAK